MDVRAGYKRTHFGEFPIDWSESTVGDEFKVQLGKMVDAARNDGAAKPYLGNAAVKWGAIDLSEVQTIRLSENELERFRLHRDDLLVCEGRGVGRSAVWEDQLPECYYQKALHRLRPRRGFDPRLMIALFRYWVDQGLLSNYVTESTIPHLTKEKLVLIPLAVPPHAEQRAIAAALSDVDALLDGLDRLIARKRDLKQAAMQQLLAGSTRLPGFGGGWEVKRLGDLFRFSGGYSASRAQLSTSGHCYLHYGDIHGSKNTWIDPSSEQQDIPRLDIALTRVSPDSLLQDGDVVFVDASEDDAGASKHVAVVNTADVPFIAGLHTIVAKPRTSQVVHEYQRYCFQTRAIREQFLFYAVGTKVTGISKTNIPKLMLPVPPLAEQTAIAAVLSDMDADLSALEARRDKTRALKQAMMQELLTGRTRLVTADCENRQA